MNQAEFQRLAEVRVREAEALLAAGLWDGAYYLAGYAIECGLKACIAKRTQAGDFPDKDYAAKCFTHDLVKLRELADLASAPMGSELAKRRDVARQWSEKVRYSARSDQEARDYLAALTDPMNGVMPWLRSHW